MAGKGPRTGSGLLERAGVNKTLSLDRPTEDAWIEVIRKMDAVYADLVQYQVELEQKNAELEVAQQFIRSVLSAMTDVLIVCDIRGNIQQVNHALVVMTGMEESWLRGMSFDRLFAADSQRLVENFPEKIRTNSIIDCELNLVAKDGRPVPLAVNCSSRFDHKGRLVGMVLIGRPVGELRQAYDALNRAHEELKQAQQQLVQSEKMASLGRLVAGVAHELNNPISFVFGNMHALKRYAERITRYLGALDQSDAPASLASLRQELKIDHVLGDIGSLIDGTLEGAERVRDIVQDLRRYSGSQQEPPSRFDLAQVIHTATHWVFKAARIKPRVQYRMPETLMLNGRKGPIQQILVNLIQNAVDVMDDQEQPRLEISCEQGADTVTVRVRDHGPGIPPSELNRIFDPFYTTKPVGKGTGLGLSISYGLACDAGGSLRADNDAGGGAVFTLELPVADEGVNHG
jgi:two-component system sensor histidine kinase HupT/HoxJ